MDLEKNIYLWICQIGRQFTSEFLGRYDQMLMRERDKSRYRHKRSRQTTIKTVYGEVAHSRVVYEVTEEDGTRHFVYLLDETLELENVGLISTNMAKLLAKGITELSYRACAAKVSEMTGQSISAMGVWNVIQALGEKVCKEEKTEELIRYYENNKEGLLPYQSQGVEQPEGLERSIRGDEKKLLAMAGY